MHLSFMIASFGASPVAVLAAAVLGFLVGWLWYSPVLFGTVWMKAMGVKKGTASKSQKKGMMKSMFWAFIAQIIVASVLGMVISAMGGLGALDGMAIAFWMWLGFVAPIMIGGVLWEGKSFTVYLISALHWLVVLVVQAAVLGTWM